MRTHSQTRLIPLFLALFACSPEAPDPTDDGWPAPFAAPYVDATAYPTVKVGEIPVENGITHYTLGFVVAAGPAACEATWGTSFSVEQGPSAWDSEGEYFLYAQIAALRALGGDVQVSFGGAADTPLAAACPTVETLLAQYRRVVDTLALTRLDFDVEGAWLGDDASVTRRSEAIARLQVERAAEGHPLHVSLTLPVSPTGLSPDGIKVVRSALHAGVALDQVNLMAMNYGDENAPAPEGQMGEYAIAAATAVHAQLAEIGGGAHTESWASIALTPMIGQNDIASEFFDLDDTAHLTSFALEHELGWLGFWSIDRDHPCEEASPSARSDCNGSTDIADWAFSSLLANFSG